MLSRDIKKGGWFFCPHPDRPLFVFVGAARCGGEEGLWRLIWCLIAAVTGVNPPVNLPRDSLIPTPSSLLISSSDKEDFQADSRRGLNWLRGLLGIFGSHFTQWWFLVWSVWVLKIENKIKMSFLSEILKLIIMKKPRSQKSVSIFEVFEILKLTEKSKVTLSLREWSLVRLTVKTSPSASNPSSQLPKILTGSTHRNIEI